MNTPGTSHGSVCRFLALACAVVLPAAAAPAQGPAGRGKGAGPAAGHQQFPPNHPAFQFDLPTGWTVDDGNDDRSVLVCSVRGRGDIGLVCLAVPNVFSLEDFTTILPGLAKEQLERQNLTDFQLVSQGAQQTGQCPSYFVITKGILKDRKMSVTFIGLISAQGRGFLMEYALPAADGPARIKDFETIIRSLTPVPP